MSAWNAAEAALFSNAEWFALKRSTTEKLFVAFEALRVRLKDTGEALQFSFPNAVTAISSKISQGEHYEGCPWVMLDYLRYFKEKDMFAFRVMAWFGHYFSAHLVLRGQFAETYAPAIIARLRLEDVYFSTHINPWSHAVAPPLSVPLSALSDADIAAHLSAHQYIKLSIKIPGTDLKLVEDTVVQYFTTCFSSN